MASRYVITQVSPAGSGTGTRNEKITDKTDRYGSSEYRYHYNEDTLTATPEQGYVFDHWVISTLYNEYDHTLSPDIQGSLIFSDTTTRQSTVNPLTFTLDSGDCPGYCDADEFLGSAEPWYWRPLYENIATVTAVFRKAEPGYTHLIVYDTATDKIMRNPNLGNKILRDSP